MKRRNLVFFLLLIFVLAVTTGAHAQATRTWVSGVGDDANPCSRTAPCKTYAGAISKTATGGIISTLDPGGFGAVTITKSITIDGSEQIAGILAAGTNGVIINAGSTGVVVLRNLEIHGAGTGLDGIRILSAGEVYVENCRIQNFTNRGINIIPNVASAVTHVVIRNSDIRNNTLQGIQVLPSNAATVRLHVAESQVAGNGSTGIDIAGNNNTASIYNSSLFNNLVGAQVQLATSTLFLEGCFVHNNGTGITSGVGQAAVTRITRCSIVGNTTNGISGSGTVVGFQTNMIVGNAGSNSVSSSVASQ